MAQGKLRRQAAINQSREIRRLRRLLKDATPAEVKDAKAAIDERTKGKP